ncbi:RNA polymerase sigma-54 factor [Methylomarinovum tepidoasis]|uniref:RNA polymerase sigma-54 factor n=1 Tax=Methylomarinovum tepidoasis TaxID=2840183 RepID=A0AAU9C3T6_9GAMM|nr:RNA polymerase factor sigma-54 [Methylomarinovum sp. IN45]BCX87724.1 RNA polymerase sigma-54 factor [Methylomarinovum sp. IN45]
MKQSLQLRQGLQLRMTPQLQQAIRLLQLSSVELKQEIQEVLESNIMLELAEEEQAQVQTAPQDRSAETSVTAANPDIPEELPLDTHWEDVYDNVHTALSGTDDPDHDFLLQRSAPEGLHEHLEWQMELSRFSERDQLIAMALIDAINEEGYLEASLRDILQALENELPALEVDEVEAVLHRIQQFDPPGVAARSLGECLAIQLRQLPEETPWRQEALIIVTRHLRELEKQNIGALKKTLGLDETQLDEVIALIRTLNPHPGLVYSTREPEYVIPDVFVFRRGERWVVSLNPETAPKLRINPYYSGMIKRADKSPDNVSMRSHLQEARWFLRSLQSRSETLLKVAQCIVDRQQGFFEHGEIAMKPMILRDVAEELGLHESTVSRVTTNKYMHTPRGIYEFKYFFSSHVGTEFGGEASATAIKALIQELIQHENPAKPLSDLKIAKLLQEKGIHVARRTVAKYREALGIPASSRRKRLL